MYRSRYLFVLALCGGFFLTAGVVRPAAAQDALAKEPGYVDFSRLHTWFQAEPTVEVNIQGPLIELVAGAAQDSDPEFARLMENLKAIQVRGFPSRSADAQTIAQRIDELGRTLEQQGWERVMHVRDEQEHVSMFVKHDGKQIAGLTVLATEPGSESVFVNIVGPMTPEQVGRLGHGLDLDALENVDLQP